MSLRINTNVEALTVHSNLVKTSNALERSLSRLSSGYRINSAKDDAAGFAVANKFKAAISSMKVAYQNATEAQSMLNVADGGYSEIESILVRMKDLATQAASGQTDTDPLASEFQLLQSEITRIASSTTYNDKALLDGTANVTFQVGQTNAANFQLTIQLQNAQASNLGVSSSTINLTDLSHAQSAMDRLDTALSSINEYMGNVGAYQNRLEYTMENLSSSIENFSASESAIRDVDMAAEVMTFTKNQILQQSGMAMLAQANSAPQQILSLLQ